MSFLRPLAGSINFNPGSALINSVDPTNEFDFAQIVLLGLHEVLIIIIAACICFCHVDDGR